jgi:hypothetical protein
METTARKRIVTGVFGQDVTAQVRRTTITAPRQRSTTSEYAVPTAPETFDVRMAKALRAELAPIVNRLHTLEATQKVLVAEIVSLRTGTLQSASVVGGHVSAISQRVQEATVATQDVAAALAPLAWKVQNQRVEHEQRRRNIEGWIDACRTVWGYRAWFLFAGAAIISWETVVFYLDHYPH